MAHLEEGSIYDVNQRILETIKPVLRKQTIHSSKNVLLMFKSIEVQLVEEKINSTTEKAEYKFLSPIYVPVHRLDSYMSLEKSLMEI